MKKIETDSLDPPVLKNNDKLRLLRDELIKERKYLYEQIIRELERDARRAIDIITQTGLAKEGTQAAPWGSYGPIQGNLGRHTDSRAARAYQIEQTLEMVYELWPKLAPARPAKQVDKKQKSADADTEV